MISFIIQSISLSLVLEFDKIKFNTNNHWINNEQPIDYRESLENTHTNKWIDKFHNDDYYIIDINDMYELNWMKKANEISMQTGKFSELYNDELDLFLIKYEPKYKHIFDGTEYFVRSENVSMKYGQHKEGPTLCKQRLAMQGDIVTSNNKLLPHDSEFCETKVGPYTNLKEIIESLVSSIRGHTPIYKDSTEIKLYLMPWININQDKEFRVFVFNKKITAISQQNLYQVLYENISDDELEILFDKYIKIIVNYFNDIIVNEIELENFTYDFAILDNDKPYFIESNSFGKEYAAGSALFCWINDDDVLYQKNKDPTIYFRYTVK